MKTTQQITPRRVATGFKLVGECYKHGMRYPGCTLIIVDGEANPVYFNESTSLAEAISILKAKGEIDVTQLEKSVDNWVKTGQWALKL